MVLERSTYPAWKGSAYCFNPCEGFGGFGTVHIQLGRAALIVSIPVRDLVVLERSSGCIWAELGRVSSFNPCEGFGGFGTSTTAAGVHTTNVSIPVRDLVVLEPTTI